MKGPRVRFKKAEQFQSMKDPGVWFKKAQQFQTMNIQVWLRKFNSFKHRTLMSLIKENSTVSIIEHQWDWFKKAEQFQS